MKLKTLFPHYEGSENPEIRGLSTSSQETKPGDLFLCIKGLKVDRHLYAQEAVRNGAVAVVVSRSLALTVPQIKCKDVNEEVENIAERFYEHPEKSLCLIGVTGTDGKTSVATLIQHFLGPENCGYIGTNGVSCAGYEAHDVHNTTPDKLHLLKYFAAFRDRGCKYVAMEASSEGFYYQRLSGIAFQRAAISNITSEHLNTHKTFENYLNCKQQLFRQNESFSILNADDAHYSDFAAVAHNILRYGRGQGNDLQIKNFHLASDHTDITFVYQGGEEHFVSPLLGDFNVENVAEAFLVCLSLGMNMNSLRQRLKDAHILGRMETICLGQNFTVIVDYAHTTNGVKRFLSFVRELPHRQIIAVSGQAGERDKGKRKYVGEAIARNANYVYFTAEDPRHEKVENIIADMCENIVDLHNYESVLDRGEAIQKAIFRAQKNDVVVILGKGGETTMTYGDKDISFSDIDCAKEAIQNKLKQKAQ